eukprot:4518196-Alexandrium_andersonii.AAC.1
MGAIGPDRRVLGEARPRAAAEQTRGSTQPCRQGRPAPSAPPSAGAPAAPLLRTARQFGP